MLKPLDQPARTAGAASGTPLARRLVPTPGSCGTTFGAALQQLVEADPTAGAVTCGPDTLTREQLFRQSFDLALSLVEAGVQHGDYVSTVMDNSCDALVAVFASWLAGGVPQVLSPRLAARELQEVLELTGPAAVIGTTDPDVVGARPSFGTPFPMHAEAVATLPDRAAPAWKAPTSGGSTGRPKVIVAGQAAVMENVSLGDVLKLPTCGSVLVTAPLSHNAPFCVATLAVLRGCHAVLMPRFEAMETVRLIEQYAVRWVYAVPTMMARMWKLPIAVREQAETSSLQVWMHMAAACAPALKEAFIDWLGPDVVWELYGGTEGQALTVIDGREWLAHRGSVGKVVSGAMEVRDDDGVALPPGEVGRIWLRRDAGTDETYRYLGAVARSDAEGWETLGDLGYVDDEGYVYLADRDSDMFTVGGVNVYPAEVEAVLLEHVQVRDACVIGLPDDELGSVPHAIVQTTDAAPIADVHDWLSTRLASYKRPRSVEFVADALHDDAGKVRRAQLRRDRLVAPAAL